MDYDDKKVACVSRAPVGKTVAAIVKFRQVAQEAQKLVGMFLVIEFTEEFTMESNDIPSAGSISNDCSQNAAAQNAFHHIQFNEPPIRDAGMAAEISRLIKSQILHQANKAVYAQAGALNPSALSLVQDFG